MCIYSQGGHKPGKPGILRDFSEHGKLREYLCKTAVGSTSAAGSPLMKVIFTFTFCCDNLRKSTFMALEKPGKLREFFSPTLWPP